MKAKSSVTAVLLAFVGVSVAYLIIQESPSRPSAQSESGQMEVVRPESKTPDDVEPTSAEPEQQTGHKLIAYYLKDAFPQALRTGELEWQAINVEEPANEHFVEDFQITSSALVLVNTQNGEQEEWRTLERVWELVGDELGFKTYVEAEALAFLEQDS